MPDKEIHELTEAFSVAGQDLFVLEQSEEAKKLSGQTLITYLLQMIDGHGGISSITSSKSGGTTTVTITLADHTTSSFQIKDGNTGARGTGYLSVTSAPSAYTTPVSGFTPSYRLALSTIRTQSGVDEVFVGDQIRYSYYTYPVGAVTTTYAYLGARVSIRGAQGPTGGVESVNGKTGAVTLAASDVGASNVNLIDNPWFTVNQRGATTLPTTNGAYHVDRWKAWTATGVIDSNGITLDAGTIYQHMEPKLWANLVGRTLTGSIMLTDGTIVSGSISNFSGNTTYFPVGNGYALVLKADEKTLEVSHSASSVSIRAVKVEIGSSSTLAYDAIPDYTQELLKCQRYFWRLIMRPTNAMLWAGYVETANQAQQAWITVFPPVPMRTIPVINSSDWSKYYVASVSGTRFNLSSAPSITVFARENFAGNGAAFAWDMRIITSGSGFETRYAPAYMHYSGGNDVSWIEFSADL